LAATAIAAIWASLIFGWADADTALAARNAMPSANICAVDFMASLHPN